MFCASRFRIEHDNTGRSPDWFLEKVSKIHTCGLIAYVYIFRRNSYASKEDNVVAGQDYSNANHTKKITKSSMLLSLHCSVHLLCPNCKRCQIEQHLTLVLAVSGRWRWRRVSSSTYSHVAAGSQRTTSRTAPRCPWNCFLSETRGP